MKDIPEFLKKRLQEQYDLEEQKHIIQGYQKKRPVTFRINRLKTTVSEVEEILRQNQIPFRHVSWLEDAFILPMVKEEDIRNLSIYQEGKIYLQSLSSMIPVLFLDVHEKESILDMTASPGGKTTEIASFTNDQALITACEKNKIRFDRLSYNVQKQGVKRITILREDSRYLDDYFAFDKILLDAPCSGSGTLLLESIPSSFQEELVIRSTNVQRELLKKAIHLLKKGGILVYSTCSILKEENELQLAHILKEEPVEIVPISLDDVPTLKTNLAGTIVVMPTEYYEGFFVAKLRKL